MKKLNRFVSLGMVLAMLLCLLVPSASAFDVNTKADHTNANSSALATYQTDGFWTALPFDKIVKVSKGVTIPDDTTFTFTMTPLTPQDGTKVGDVAVKAGPALTTSSVTVGITTGDLSDTDGKDADEYPMTVTSTDTEYTVTKTASFTLPTDLEPGIYRYRVQETAGSESYVTYSEDVYTVDLYVMQGADGKVGITNIVAVNTTKADLKDNIVFTNEIKTGSLKIQKTVDSNMYNGEEFTFFIKIPAGGDALDLEAGKEITGTKYKKNASSDAYEENGTVTVTVAGDMGDVVVTSSTDDEGNVTYAATAATKFTLADDEYVVFNNLPIGMVFYMAEVNYVADGYTTEATFTGTPTDPETATIKGVTKTGTHQIDGVIVDGTNLVEYKNTKNVNPETGINLDVLPYVVVLAIALGGCVLFIFNKKRRTVR
jgi:pilin isopeptide linkage protein